ncbi:transcriptional regulator [Niastella vici]|uniref:Transcriptional regulator n=1 Tax=Niastella vici TaxID=1703345 RepID=A0A1V9G950_9BACT|nr:helix-turn-helix transcriptional regulator [Niastella vici]OQP67181.1 transcriptional regulator [Niastella vici]
MSINPLPGKIHEGHNVKRLREILGIKQEVLADALGFNQQKISLLEQREYIDPAVLEEIAKVLKVPVEAIRNFSEDAVIFNIQNNSWHDNSANNNNYLCNINPIEKIIELYEALLKSEREKVALLEKMLEKK